MAYTDKELKRMERYGKKFMYEVDKTIGRDNFNRMGLFIDGTYDAIMRKPEPFIGFYEDSDTEVYYKGYQHGKKLRIEREGD